MLLPSSLPAACQAKEAGRCSRCVAGCLGWWPREARQASLVIAGSAGHPWHGEAQDAIDAVLFDAAAPLLLMPPAFPASLGAHVTVAWE